jgi:hypothetical protein
LYKLAYVYKLIFHVHKFSYCFTLLKLNYVISYFIWGLLDVIYLAMKCYNFSSNDHIKNLYIDNKFLKLGDGQNIFMNFVIYYVIVHHFCIILGVITFFKYFIGFPQNRIILIFNFLWQINLLLVFLTFKKLGTLKRAI